ncbi:alpha/beta fold hydrolase [Demetria terragena]|uniref:alpha/beta fold hydrolase n=1 Tax=Demetria terragena TaxID=63959 RepID=UPI00036D4008|nr:alpha/beta hydrolase [Demetria terragena]
MAGGVLGWGTSVLATTAGAAIGVAADRLWTDRQAAVRLGREDDFHESADQELAVIARDGVPLHVEIDEPRGAAPTVDHDPAPTVILVHGFALTLESWVFQRRALREAGYRVVLLDLRGHGRSEEGEPESYTVGQLGRDLAEVIEQVVPTGPLVLIGHSMGGMTLMSFAGQFPKVIRDRVIGVGFVSTSPGDMHDVHFGLGHPIGAVLHRVGPGAVGRLAGREAVLAVLLKAGRDVESLMVHHFSFGSHVPMSVVRFTGQMVFGTKISVLSAFLGDLSKHDQHLSLAAFDGIETLVLVGSDDKITPARHSESIVAAIPGAEHVVVDDAGHMLLVEYPDLVNDQLLDLLARARRAINRPRRRTRVRKTVTDMSAKRRTTVAVRSRRRGKATSAKPSR